MNIASTVFPDAPAIPAESMPTQNNEEEAQPFGDLLASLTAEVPTAPPLVVEPAGVDESVEAPVAEIGAENAADEENPNPEPDPDAMVLSSCLAMWQILPPAAPTPTPAAEIGAGAENISSATDEPEVFTGSSSFESSSGAVPVPSAPIADSPARAAASGALKPPSCPPASFAVEAKPEVLRQAVASDPAGVVAALPANPGLPSKPSASKGSRSVAAVAEVPRVGVDGMPVAKEQRAMTEPVFHRPATNAPAAFAESETRSETAGASRFEASGSVAAAPERTARDDANGGWTDSQDPRGGADPLPFLIGKEVRDDFALPKTDAKPVTGETARVIEHIERAIERMHTQGSQRMELRLPMREGEEVVVKLRVEHGEVKATFQSASEGLRQALEAGWSQASQASPERAARAIPAVFESPAMQSGMGSFQQSPNQRERSGSDAPAEPSFAPQPQSQARRVTETLRTTPTTASTEPRKIYA